MLERSGLGQRSVKRYLAVEWSILWSWCGVNGSAASRLSTARPPSRILCLAGCCAWAVHGTRVFCLGETVAVRLFKRLREGATVPVARAALDRVLTDEVRHRDFGWLLLEWLTQTGGVRGN